MLLFNLVSVVVMILGLEYIMVFVGVSRCAFVIIVLVCGQVGMCSIVGFFVVGLCLCEWLGLFLVLRCIRFFFFFVIFDIFVVMRDAHSGSFICFGCVFGLFIYFVCLLCFFCFVSFMSF